MFDILKNLLTDGKKENTNLIDNNNQKLEKCIIPDAAKKISKSSDNIDLTKANQCPPIYNEVTQYTMLSPMNQELFNLMKDQLKEKDLQISKLNEILNQAQYLHKNTQILSKQQSQQDLVPLKDDLEENLKKVKINVIEHKEEKHKGFFGILFEK